MPQKRKARSCQKGQTRTQPKKATRSAGPAEGSAPDGGERRQRATRRGRPPLASAARSPPPPPSRPRARRVSRAEPPLKRMCRRRGSPPARRSSSSDSSATLQADAARIGPARDDKLHDLPPRPDAPAPPVDTPTRTPEDGGGTALSAVFSVEGDSRVVDSDSSVASDLQTHDVAYQHELQDENAAVQEPASAVDESIEPVLEDLNDVSMSSHINEGVSVPEGEAIAERIENPSNEPNDSVLQITESPIADVNGNVISSSLSPSGENISEISVYFSVESTESDRVLEISPTLSSGCIPTPHESEENVAEGSAVTRVESQNSVAQSSELDLLASEKLSKQDQPFFSEPMPEAPANITFIDLTEEKDVYGSSNENNETHNSMILDPDRSATSFGSVEMQVSSSDLINTENKDVMIDGADGVSSVVSMDDFVSYESFQQNSLRKCSSVTDMTSQEEMINKTEIHEASLEDEPLDLSTESSKTHCNDSVGQVKHSVDVGYTRHVNLKTLSTESSELPIFMCAPKVDISNKGESSSSKCVVPTWAMPIFQPFSEENTTIEITKIEDLETHANSDPNNRQPSPSNRTGPSSDIAASAYREPAEDEDKSESSDYSAFLKLAENMLDWSYGEDGRPPPLEALQVVAEVAFEKRGRSPAPPRAPNSPRSPNSPNSLSSDDSYHSAHSTWDDRHEAAAGRSPKGGAGPKAESGTETAEEGTEASRRASQVRVQFRPEVVYARYSDDCRNSRLSLEVHPRKLLRNIDALRSSARASDRRLAARVRAAERERRAEQRRQQRARERAEREWRLRVRRGLVPSGAAPPPPPQSPSPPPQPSHWQAVQPYCVPPPPQQPVASAAAAYLQTHAHASPLPRSRPRVNARRRRRRVSFSPWVTERGPAGDDSRRASGDERSARDATAQPP